MQRNATKRKETNCRRRDLQHHRTEQCACAIQFTATSIKLAAIYNAPLTRGTRELEGEIVTWQERITGGQGAIASPISPRRLPPHMRPFLIRPCLLTLPPRRRESIRLDNGVITPPPPPPPGHLAGSAPAPMTVSRQGWKFDRQSPSYAYYI